MKLFLNKYKYLLLTFLISFVIFYPSLFVFFTNDDFFFLKISQDPLQWFNNNFAMFRPLTTQVFYFVGGKDPFLMHIISFLFFFGIIYLVYKLAEELFKNENIATISAFLYAVSATHFGTLYYLAAFQELGMTFFVLLSCLFFIKNKNILSFTFFVLALLSKETAVVTPLLITLIYFFQKLQIKNTYNIKKFAVFITPFVICLFAYLLIRAFKFGFTPGDSYVWDFSIQKMVNTAMWYLLWSFNLPESLVDFVGSGLKVNPRLFVYWGQQIIPILILTIIQLILIAVVLIKKRNKESKLAETLFIFWFGISLLPVIFLPLHKFSFYLTLPMFAISTGLAYIFIESHIKKFWIILFLCLWTITSVLTLKFTYDTNWITQEEIISKKVFDYFQSNGSKYAGKQVVFIDTNEDVLLPWSPTATVRTTLSGNNFFVVFYPELAAKISYTDMGDAASDKGDLIIKSRQFLGY